MTWEISLTVLSLDRYTGRNSYTYIDVLQNRLCRVMWIYRRRGFRLYTVKSSIMSTIPIKNACTDLPPIEAERIYEHLTGLANANTNTRSTLGPGLSEISQHSYAIRNTSFY